MKIYYAKIGTLSEEEMRKAFEQFSKERIEKVERIKDYKRRNQCIWAGILLEYALREVGLKSNELTFLKNIDGKPYIKEVPEIHFNLSHAEAYVAVATDAEPIGIDIESVRKDCQKLADRFFAEEEVTFLQENWSNQLFTKFWTRKESYIKAVGYGMRIPLDAFSTVGSQVRLKSSLLQKMPETEGEYYIESVPLNEDYWLSVCRKNVPICAEEVVPVQIDIKGFLKG